MSQILVFFDTTANPLSAAQQEVLTLALTLGQVSVVTGTAPTATAQQATEALSVEGVSQVFIADSPVQSPSPAVVDLVHAAAQEISADTILGVDTPDSVDVLARAAVRLDAALITGATGIANGVVTKSVLADSYTTTAEAAAGPLVATLRPNTVHPNLTEGAAPSVTQLSLPEPTGPTVEVVQRTPLPDSGRPALSEARVVVAGGRGVDGDFTLVEQLADALGGAVGASRAATDAGWIDHSAQVGQTGVVVSPQLYISLGISGAIQQKAGMQTSGTIIAVNKDEDAPVFEIADFGVVGDLTEVVPQVVEEIRKRRG